MNATGYEAVEAPTAGIEIARRAVLLHSMDMDGWIDVSYDALDKLIEEMEEGDTPLYGPILTINEVRWAKPDMTHEESIVYLENLTQALDKFIKFAS